jgi:hypothetical protein
VAAAGADPQSTDPIEVDLVAGGKEVDGAPDVFDPRRRALGEVRFAAAFALIGGVEDQGDEPVAGELAGVNGRKMLSKSATRVPLAAAG